MDQGNKSDMGILPTKLKYDCILEAIVEIRFDGKEPTEIVLGRLIDCPDWASYTKHRMPISDVPVEVRISDPNLRNLPLFDLRSDDGLFAVKVGSHVLSVHNVGSYVGWEKFRPAIKIMVEQLIAVLPNVTVKRIGIRYVNATTKNEHKISSVGELNFSVKFGEEEMTEEEVALSRSTPGFQMPTA